MSRKLSLVFVLAAYPTVVFSQPLAIEPAPTPPPPTATVVVPESPPAHAASVVATNDGEILDDDWNGPVFVTGAVTFGLAYGTSAYIAGNNASESANRLVIPLAGPWLALADRPPCGGIAQASCDHETAAKILLVADGIFQAAGAIAMIDGILEPSGHVMRHRMAQDKSVHLTPTVVGSQEPTPGLGVFGRF
jgi:hypothetical protein